MNQKLIVRGFFLVMGLIVQNPIAQSEVQAESHGPMTPLAAPQKKTICTVTINSDDEKKVFQKYLDPDLFQFVELLHNKEDDGFLRRSCANKNLSCDVVLISGHFGGGFTDNKEFFLPLEDMEKAACDSCPSVLANAKMVYLMGCNTLAGKNLDGRTPDEYYRILVDEVGEDPAEARANVALRYSAIGDSFRDRLRRVFRGSAVLGGFTMKSPLGVSNAKSFNAYFEHLAPGVKHDGVLDAVERRAISEAYYMELERVGQNETNGENKKRYEHTGKVIPRLTEVLGPNFITLPGIQPGSTEDIVAGRVCSMNHSSREKTAAIEDIVNTGDRASIIQVLPYLLDMSNRGSYMDENQKRLFHDLSSHQQLRDIMVGPKGIVSQLAQAPEEEVKTVDLTVNLGWMTPAEQMAAYHQAAVYMWNNSSGFKDNRPLRRKMDQELRSIQASELSRKAFRSDAVWFFMLDYAKERSDILEVARANFGLGIETLAQRYAANKAELYTTDGSLNPKLSPASVTSHKEKMDQARRGVDTICNLMTRFPTLKPDLSTLLAPFRKSFEIVSSRDCLAHID